MAFPTDWGRKCKLTIADAMSGAALSDFPLLLTEDTLPSEMFDADGANPALNGGGDIRFSSDEAGSTQLACDVVSFVTDNNPALGTAEIHVKVPSVAAAADTDIWVWYNKAGESQPAVGDSFGRNAVWSDYFGVWHGGSLTNATGDGLDVIEQGSPAPTASSTGGPWGGGHYEFDGSQNYLARFENTAYHLPEPLTFTGWFNSDSAAATQVIIALGNNDSSGFYRLFIDGATTGDPVQAQKQRDTGGANAPASVSGYTAEVWSYGAGLFVADDERYAWVDGTKSTAATTDHVDPTPERLAIGVLQRGPAASNLVHFFDGKIGETRIRQSILSDDWLAAEYNNQSAPATYITAGTPEDGAAAGATVPRTGLLLRGIG